MQKLVEHIASQIKSKIKQSPEVAVILGSGLANFAESMKDKVVIKYDELDGMLKSKVEGHKNQFVVGKIGKKIVICMQGRFHPYDGFNAKQCVLPVYVFKLLGVKTLIVTNASGAVNLDYDAGDVMIIKSQINLTGMNPLIDGAIIDYGKQFIDMKNCYDKEYIEIVKQIAKENNIDLKCGVYAQMLGPTYETPAEVNMLRVIGVDSVAMSTALEVIASTQCEMKTLGFSCISNKASSFDGEELSHEEVLKSSKIANEKLKLIIPRFLERI